MTMLSDKEDDHWSSSLSLCSCLKSSWSWLQVWWRGLDEWLAEQKRRKATLAAGCAKLRSSSSSIHRHQHHQQAWKWKGKIWLMSEINVWSDGGTYKNHQSVSDKGLFQRCLRIYKYHHQPHHHHHYGYHHHQAQSVSEQELLQLHWSTQIACLSQCKGGHHWWYHVNTCYQIMSTQSNALKVSTMSTVPTMSRASICSTVKCYKHCQLYQKWQ